METLLTSSISDYSSLFQELTRRIRSVIGDGEQVLHAPGIRESRTVARALTESRVSVDEGILNEATAALENLTGQPDSVLTSSGTSALHLAMLALGVSPGDTVICPAISFVATANAIRYCRANPYFIDVDQEDLALSPEALEISLQNLLQPHRKSDSPSVPIRPAAIVAVSVFGLAPQLEAIESIAEKYDIPVIIDAAGALGTEIRGSSILARGTVAITSFNGNKVITAGGGGAIFSRSDEILGRAQHLALVAKEQHPHRFQHSGLGFNYRMPSLNAALLIDQLADFQKILKSKRELHRRYEEALKDLPVHLFTEKDQTTSNYWLNSIMFPEGELLGDAFCDFLISNGLHARQLWEPLPELPHLKKFPCGQLPTTDAIRRRVVSLPSSYFLAGEW